MELNLKIEGLSCGHCVNAVDNILKEIDGVISASVSLPDNAKVSFDESKITLTEIKKAINDSEIYKAL
jgi:copper chaperone